MDRYMVRVEVFGRLGEQIGLTLLLSRLHQLRR